MADEPTARNEATFGEQYEQLRQVALTGHTDGWRHGLGVLATRGMAAWMSAWQSVPQAAPSTRGNTAAPAFGQATSDMVRVLAAMALAHV